MKNPSVIIIKKVKKGGHGGHHGGAWKVAYADFVTAMMAFFLVMWLVAQSNAVKAAVAGYFKDPGVFDYEKSTGMVPGGQPGATQSRRSRRSSATAGKPVSAEEGIKALEATAKRIHHVLENMPEFKKLGKQIKMEVTPEGLRIELLEGAEETFFDSGSAQLKHDTVTPARCDCDRTRAGVPTTSSSRATPTASRTPRPTGTPTGNCPRTAPTRRAGSWSDPALVRSR